MYHFLTEGTTHITNSASIFGRVVYAAEGMNALNELEEFRTYV